MKPVSRLVLAALLLTGLAPVSAFRQAVVSHPDLVLQFTFGSCTLDTTTSLLTHDRVPRVEIPLTLTEDQMSGIAASLDEIGFFAYPSTFIGAPPGLTAYSINAAASAYRLNVQLADRAHVVSWMDSTRPSTEEADRLRSLFERVIGFIRSRPGYEQLIGQGRDCR